jgi:serine/threonine-protein kinase
MDPAGDEEDGPRSPPVTLTAERGGAAATVTLTAERGNGGGSDGSGGGGGSGDGVGAAVTLTADAALSPRLGPKEAPAGSVPSMGEFPALPATVAERYESLGLLGRGGMGAVYRARDRKLGREVALKLLFDDVDGERLLREARAQARVEHEHACKIYEVGIEEGAGYIAMQYVAGEPLDRAAAHMTVEQKVRVLRQVCLALHEAHRLGLVHRDVKPSNVLVERGDDGTFHPYLTDFGIAREAGAQGHTMTGAIAGTPAYMAPEQARGEIRALDRRTDVYGLGATAYAVLAGRPPYEGAEPWALIRRILAEDAPALRRVAPAVPADLEAIVARCLEKDPGRRYASARALADDLGRFLDGDAVEARRLSPGYVLWRKARRHRGWLALAGAVLLAALAVAALWIRDRQQAARRAELARELGQKAEKLEGFLLRAYELPLHDVEREREVVRAGLPDIKARMVEAGAAGEGPGHYALGRAHLALQEPEQARVHLAAAAAAGYASPDLDYALGVALGELYDRALAQARRLADPAQQAARVAALEAEYAAPARRHLEAARGTSLEAPAYVEGLIELRAGRPEAALARAKAAQEQAPWLYEPRRLEGDAHFALGNRHRPDAAFDYERMMIEYRAAIDAYRGAADIARSDPAVHEAECRLWAQIMNASTARPETLRASYEAAAAACGRAAAATSLGASPRIERAFVEVLHAWLTTVGDQQQDPAPAIEAAATHAAEVLRLAPAEPMAHYLVGLAAMVRAQYRDHLGVDRRADLERAIAAHEQALRLDPAFVWALNELSYAYTQRAASEALRGIDPEPSLDRAVAYSDQVTALESRAVSARGDAAIAELARAEHLLEVGRDPAGALERARAAIAAGRALGPDWHAAGPLSVQAAWIEAAHAVAAGAAPESALARAEALVAAELSRTPDSADLLEWQARVAEARAAHLLEAGQDPAPALRVAEDALRRAQASRPWFIGFLVGRARVDALRLRWVARTRAVTAEELRVAAAPLEALVSPGATLRADPRPAAALAELHEIRAASLVERGSRADDDIAAGLAQTAAALALYPRLPSALATRDALLLARRRAAALPAAEPLAR